MGYIDAEKLVAEIERLLIESEKNINNEGDAIYSGEWRAYDKVLSLITSLQKEQTEIEKEAEISPSMVSNFGPCAFNLSVMLTQEEMAKMNIAPFLTKKVNVIIKDTK